MYDSSMYRCPYDINDCKPFRNKLNKIPICVLNNYTGKKI